MHEAPLFVFTTIEPATVSWHRWAVSASLHILFVIAILAIPATVYRETVAAPSRSEIVHLTYLPPQVLKPVIFTPAAAKTNKSNSLKAPPAKANPIPPKALAIPAAPVVRPVITPVLAEPPRLETARITEPKLELPAPPPPPTAPSFDRFASDKTASAAPPGPKPPVVKTGIFGGSNLPSAGTQSAPRDIQSGGFDLPSGGQRGTTGLAKAVAVGAFATNESPARNAPNPDRPDAIHASGFADYNAPATPSASTKPVAAKPAVTPVEIISKPNPAYTEEAREKKVEGEVQLDVVFGATGKIQVLRVVRGLGLGLDESARSAASQIRFRPGTKDGNPVDMRGIVHIVFKLS
jgi:TonB family protein